MNVFAHVARAAMITEIATAGQQKGGLEGAAFKNISQLVT